MKIKNNLILFQIRRHIGELDWILPLLFKLKKKGYKIITYFDKKKIYETLTKNEILYNEWKQVSKEYYIDKLYSKLFIKFILRFFIFLEKKFSLKILTKRNIYFLLRNQYDIRDIKKKNNLSNFKFFFISNNNYSNLYLNFKEINNNIKIIRFPTSQWVRFFFKKNLKKNYNEKFYGDKYLFQSKNNAKDYFGSNFNKESIQKKIIYCGNIKYESWWMNKIYNFSKDKLQSKVRILVATRGYRLKPKNNFPKNSFLKIINEILRLGKYHKNLEFIFKTHPSKSELNYLEKILKEQKNIKWSVSDKHISLLAKNCNFAITMNTSACLDIVSMNKVCIEYWLNDEDYTPLMKYGSKYFTTFQKYGVVKNVNTFKELNKFVYYISNKKNYEKMKNLQKKNFIKMNNLSKYNLNYLIDKILK